MTSEYQSTFGKSWRPLCKVNLSSWIQSRRTGSCGCPMTTSRWSETRRRPRRATARSASPATAATASQAMSTSTAAATTGRLWLEEVHGKRRLCLFQQCEESPLRPQLNSLSNTEISFAVFLLNFTFLGICTKWHHQGQCHICHAGDHQTHPGVFHLMTPTCWRPIKVLQHVEDSSRKLSSSFMYWLIL